MFYTRVEFNHLYIVDPLFPHVFQCPDNSNSGFLMDAVIEKFEEAEGRNPGETTISDLPGVLKLKKELCESQVEFKEYVFFRVLSFTSSIHSYFISNTCCSH